MKTTESHANVTDHLMTSVEHMSLVLAALPDPAFLLSRRGKYLAVFGGKDARYYHDGRDLVGLSVSDLMETNMANWQLEKIDEALQSRQLLITEYELSNEDVKGLPDEGPNRPIWFEGRIQALDFLIDNEGVVLWVASNISKRHDLEIQLRELSYKDQLTDLFNRRKLEDDFTLHSAALARYSVPTAILLFDLDNLKHVNDTYGHHAGDNALLAIATTCQSQLRKTDCAYRLGGDEFVIVLSNTELKQAIQFAERLQERFNITLQQFCSESTNVTVSMGVTTLLLKDQSFESTIKRADGALYKAKRDGKNKVLTA